MNIRIISEKKDAELTPTEKLLDKATKITSSFQSVRRGATKSQREQGAKADQNPDLLLSELGVGPPPATDNVMKNIMIVLSGFLNGKKSNELKNVFGTPSLSKDSYDRLGVFVPLTKIAMDAVRINPTAAAREFAFWLHSVVWASHMLYRTLGPYAKSTSRQRLRVDFGNAGFVVYFSNSGWNSE